MSKTSDPGSKPIQTTNSGDGPPSTKRIPTSVAILGFSIAVSLLALYFSGRLASPSPHTGYYAICSRQGNIYTVDHNNSRVDCIVVNNSVIIDTREPRYQIRFFLAPLFIKSFSAATKKLHNAPIIHIPRNAVLVPGLSDSHGHLLEYGASRQLPLEGTTTISETVSRVREYILRTPSILNNSDAFIRGGGWDHTSWPGAAWPTAVRGIMHACHLADLSCCSQRTAMHSGCRAEFLELSDPFPASVDGGVILTDANGAATGMLLDNAQELLNIPPLTDHDLLQRFTTAVNDALAYGLTSVHDAGLDPASLEFFSRQARRGTIPIRIYAMRFFNDTEPYWGNVIPKLTPPPSERLTARSVKIFADGALRTGGSALYEPYADNHHTRGFMRIAPEVLFDFIPQFLRDGWQVNVHAIGDRANGVVLDAFEASLKDANVTALRPRLEHAQLMTKEDMERLGRLGVIASVQPTHAISDMWYAQDRLGPERIKGLYAFRTLIGSGARITLGSDFPVETMNPLASFYAAITRVSIDGDSPHGPGGWFPEERLTREEALRGMTIDPAYASFSESYLGSLEPGKRADFTVLSRNIMEIPPAEILGVKVMATVIDGAVAYGAL
ncbi:Amidohydro-3 domain-containing protein [Mycena sanguinolenta]|uniref:Amidohydro-3 domain-containing protein n=1 Tax=Mycena sanguinolenta TaxID=230812 RepID=A0A8H7DH40_9AGAR|nr:Amidohydro-3 domain-containing protein [Mycena sanguinolenta]